MKKVNRLSNSKFISRSISNNSGFIIADFLFSFALVISCGIIVFALTFSLATVEISQYMVWSAARNYSAGNFDPLTAQAQAKKKFDTLADKFPLISGRGAASTPWFTLTDPVIGDLAKIDADLIGKLGVDKINKDVTQQVRQPWIGVKSDLQLKLLSGLRVPFLGPVTGSKDFFTFPIRAFILRHPSQQECYSFFSKEKRYNEGILKLNDSSAEGSNFPTTGANEYVPIEDNGC